MKTYNIFFKSMTLDLVVLIAITVFAGYQTGYTGPYLVLWVVWATTYPVGKILQAHLVGPRITRWYLADVGYIAWYPLIVFNMHSITSDEHSLMTAYYAALIFLLAGVGAELYEMWRKIGGEWVDILIFCSTFYLFCVLHGSL